MKKSILFWFLAVLITLGTAHFQRFTGPTYPLKGSVVIDSKLIRYKFDRSHGGQDNHVVQILTNDPTLLGVIEWKRYKTDDPWTISHMTYENGYLRGELPGQPPAGKLEYRLMMRDGQNGNGVQPVPKDRNVVIRFKGTVPAWVLFPHIIGMFGALLLSARTGLETASSAPKFKRLTLWTVGLLTVGGMIFGPIVQKYAFDAFWTGFPFGTDLTDNKTLIAWLAWLVALFAVYRLRSPKRWVFGASLVTFVIFLIPHSMLGSEIDYKKLDEQKRAVEVDQVKR